MSSSTPIVVLFCFLSLPAAIRSQITISSVSGCDNNALGTATYSTQLTLPTGSQLIKGADFWQQAGANWTFSTETGGIIFDELGIPGWGSPEANIPQVDHDALKLDGSNTKWTLLLPTTPPSSGQYDIVFNAGVSSVISSPTPSKTSSSSSIVKRYYLGQASPTKDRNGPTVTETAISELKLERKRPIGAKFRRASGTAKFKLIIVGTFDCFSNPSGTSPKPTIPVTTNAAVASSCSNNEISAVTASWSAYGVTNYMSSLLAAATTAPTAPQVNGAALIHSDVNPPGAMCTYTSQCNGISCPDVKDYNSGTQLSVQRFLAYTAVVNMNNYFNGIYSALMDAGTISSLIDGNIVTTFFTNPTPSATWEQIMNQFTPLLGMFAALLGPFSEVAGVTFSVGASIMSAISSGGVANSISPVVDKRFTEYSSISDFVGNYLKATVTGIEHAYNQTIGPASSADGWVGSPLAPADMRTGYFGSGYWVDSDHTQNLSNNLLDNFIRIFTYKAINFALVDSGCFIMYVPYNTPLKDTNGNMIDGIDQSYCETQLQIKDDIGNLTVCDAPGGMARIINAGTIKNGDSLLSGVPQGWDSNFTVLPDEPFTIAGAIKGSIASWRTGDFGFDASDPYNSAFTSGNGLTTDQALSLSQLVVAETTAGFFNLPVCETFDLRFFPLTSGGSCSACGLGRGGMPGSTAKFTDHVNDTVTRGLQNAVPPSCMMGYESVSCSQVCPTDPYGPSTQQPNAAGYTPGWCGVHVVQYQKNEGPAATQPAGTTAGTSVYRMTVTIYDGQSLDITNNTAADTTVASPDHTLVPYSSKLPFPLLVASGAQDSDVVTYSYHGVTWNSSDTSVHHCNLNSQGWDSGSRQGDCGFSC